VIRILMIFVMLRLRVGGSEGLELLICINDYNQAINSWESSLPGSLLFSEAQLRKQLMYIDTSSSSAAWSFCCMHLIRVSSTLAISILEKERSAIDQVMAQAELVARYLGCQTRNDMLLESVLLCMVQYLKEADVEDNGRETDRRSASTLQRTWQTSFVGQLTLPSLKSTGLLGGSSIPEGNQTPS